MPGLAPAQKEKKGRLTGGGTVPQVTVSANPTQVVTGVATGGYTATANDVVDGDLTGVIDWYSDLDAASVGTGGSPSITLTALGEHKLTVSVIAPTGTQTSSLIVRVNVVAP